MNRRELFGLMAGAVVAPTELIVPSKAIFLPPAGGWPTSCYERVPLRITRLTDASLGIISYWEVMARPQDFYGPDNPYPSWRQV